MKTTHTFNILRLFLTIIALLAGSNLRGETVLVTQINGDPCGALHILTVFQRESEVIVTKHVEELNMLCPEVLTMLQATFEMDFPSIALREVDSFDNVLGSFIWQVLYRNGAVENSYNPDWGDGWVDTRAAGYVNIKRYPWIYHPGLGWLKVTEGKIVSPSSTVQKVKGLIYADSGLIFAVSLHYILDDSWAGGQF